jgi:radical SAM protein with 4Fe4S-binding SPASM domain
MVSFLIATDMNKNGVRYNQEYFGYIVGFPDGRIILTKDSAKNALENGASIEEIFTYQLKELEVAEGFHLHTPVLVWLEITKECNLKCPHCYIDGGLTRDHELSTVEILQQIDEMADMGVWAIAITGGEPTLHPDFALFVRHARKRDLLVGVATHGLHLTEELLQNMPTEGVIISISLDDLHLTNKNPLAEFNIVSEALIRCQKYGFHTNIMTNTNRKNVNRLEDMIKWAEDHNVSVRSVPFSPIGDRAKKNAHELENTIDDVYESAKFWVKEVLWEHKYHEEVGLCVGIIFNYGLTMAYMTNRCSSARYLCYLAADGTMYPCTMCAGEKLFPAGNIRDRGFAQTWRAEWDIRKFSWENFKETCEGCPLNNDMYYCSSRCPAMSHARHGNFISCGASDFEKLSLVVRTGLMRSFDQELLLKDITYIGPQLF